MENKYRAKINNIHSSDIFGIFIETGCGQPISAKLFTVAGASKTVYLAESPYNKDYQHQKYDNKNFRAVSLESIEKILDYWQINKPEEVNTTIVTSFQISDANDIINHGWIGYQYKETRFYYHVTLSGKKERRESIIDYIGRVGINILEAKNDLNVLKQFANESFYTFGIDIIADRNKKSLLRESLEMIEYANECPITIIDGKVKRLEEVIRGKSLILMKGSFNPIHNHHLNMMKKSQQIAYLETTACFAISFDTYQKQIPDIDNLIFRINSLNKLGYPVIVFKIPYFDRNIEYLRARLFEDEIFLPLGGDTANRLLESSYNNFSTEKDIESFKQNFQKVKFFCFNRAGYETTGLIKGVNNFEIFEDDPRPESSTEIRQLYKEGKLEEIKKLIPLEVYDLYINFMSETKTNSHVN